MEAVTSHDEAPLSGTGSATEEYLPPVEPLVPLDLSAYTAAAPEHIPEERNIFFHLNNITKPDVAMNGLRDQANGLVSSPPLSSSLFLRQTENLAGSPPTGKSSKVIERITNENERLKRELTAERLAKEELQRQLRLEKEKVERLEQQNDTLSGIHGANDKMVERRDRKITELKAAMDYEAERRTQAENRAREIADLLDERTSTANREVARAKEMEKKAQVHADILETRHNTYQRQLDSMKTALADLLKEREQDHNNVLQLEAIVEQYKHGLEAVYEAHANLAKAEQKRGEDAGQLREEIDMKMAKMDALGQDMTEALQKMRWVVGVANSRNSK
ncbi:hypothetical protein M501DRAFT_440907 [Patellaria atrata CBS 101060]|uniref:SWI5-dependent HO expression protein 3 n=1 Tax=Patellaria atrata CBS 101060 TaxID=1346257 RepID=A0A9P4S3E4_9PEZI|nr:hypothetical protein M501DRAFT_440907 [Patellaria atrata CBS 101060]